jgi:transporter family protein
MNPTAFLFSLAALLLWGISPVLDKLGMQMLGARPLAAPAALTIRLIAAALMVAVYASVVGAWKEAATVPRPALACFAGSALFAALLGQLAYYAALQYESVSRVLLVSAPYPLVAVVLAVIFLKEGVTMPRIAGAVLVVAGIILVKGWG